ncbi:MAG: hydrogenase maturation protease [Kiritimatiellaeota bacterium]|nr:hydrogenase maturation protease [Kiritimatiellota bacterium]
MKHDLVIFGIGNLLMSDDGVGVHAARALASAPPPGAEVVDAGTDFLSALPYLENARRVLVIDAVRGGGAPGTLYHLTEDDLAPQHDRSAHATSLLAARNLLAPSATAEVRILGIEPDVLDYGMELSPAVAAALPRVVAQARELAMNWQTESCVTV